MAHHADTQFYVRPEDVSGEWLTLTGEEARHASKVLRLRPGDEVGATDGQGQWYRAEVTGVTRDDLTARILERKEGVGESSLRLTMGVGLLKNPARFETFLEKAVELGVSAIVPLVTDRTERATFKASRAQNILIAALKQSGRTRLPELSEPVAFSVFLADAGPGVKLICHEAEGKDAAIGGHLRTGASEVCVLVGPEGGFSQAEVEQARACGFVPVSLGARRLRAETAAIAAAAFVMLSAED